MSPVSHTVSAVEPHEQQPVAVKKLRKPRIQIFKEINPSTYSVLAFASFLLIVGVWSLLSYLQLVNPVFLPAPHLVLAEFFRQLGTGTYWEHIGISVFRVSAGFVLACLIGIPIGSHPVGTLAGCQSNRSGLNLSRSPQGPHWFLTPPTGTTSCSSDSSRSPRCW